MTVSSGPSAAGPPAGDEALLQHLQSLKDRIPSLQAGLIGKNDPEQVWRDMESAKALGNDTQRLQAAIGELLGGHQAWHDEHAKAIIENQAYIHRQINKVDSKASRAMQHVKQQAPRLRALNQQLDLAQGLPQKLQQLCEQTAQLQAQLERLSAAAPPPPP